MYVLQFLIIILFSCLKKMIKNKIFIYTIILLFSILKNSFSNENSTENAIILSTNKPKPKWVSSKLPDIQKNKMGQFVFRESAIAKSIQQALSFAKSKAQVLANNYYFIKIIKKKNSKITNNTEKIDNIRAKTSSSQTIRGLIIIDSYVEQIAIVKKFTKNETPIIRAVKYKAYVLMKKLNY